MPLFDSTLSCRECHAPFLWTAGEQAFFKAKGLMNIPMRCVSCRSARREQFGLTRETVTAVSCADCGAQTTVPFIPRNGNPIYCSRCLVQARAREATERLAVAPSPGILET